MKVEGNNKKTRTLDKTLLLLNSCQNNFLVKMCDSKLPSLFLNSTEKRKCSVTVEIQMDALKRKTVV
jgi:hypothetical protein